jgi:hypothetical protein
MAKNITFNAAFGDVNVQALLDCNTFGGGSWLLTCGDISGHFMPASVFGWRYEGDPLEFDDIQIIIDIISEAEGFDLIDFTANVRMPWWLKREILTREDWSRAIASLTGQDNYIEEVKAHILKHLPRFQFDNSVESPSTIAYRKRFKKYK